VAALAAVGCRCRRVGRRCLSSVATGTPASARCRAAGRWDAWRAGPTPAATARAVDTPVRTHRAGRPVAALVARLVAVPCSAAGRVAVLWEAVCRSIWGSRFQPLQDLGHELLNLHH